MNTLSLTPKRKERLGDQLYGQILEQIVSGRINEGARLPSENEISSAFRASRPVVREALRRLQADGLVQARQGAGTFVIRRPSERIIQFAHAANLSGYLKAHEVRITLEGQAAKFAAQRRTAAELAYIEETLATLERTL